jgi:hypothetical protein
MGKWCRLGRVEMAPRAAAANPQQGQKASREKIRTLLTPLRMS